MKISALKKMVREAVRAEMKAMEARLEEKMIQTIEEARTPSLPTPQGEPTGLSEIRQKFKKTQPGGEAYEGVEGTKKTTSASGGPKPDNPKKILDDGKVYASGNGILEWFEQESDSAASVDHKKRLEKMSKTDEYVKSVLKRGKR